MSEITGNIKHVKYKQGCINNIFIEQGNKINTHVFTHAGKTDARLQQNQLQWTRAFWTTFVKDHLTHIPVNFHKSWSGVLEEMSFKPKDYSRTTDTMSWHKLKSSAKGKCITACVTRYSVSERKFKRIEAVIITKVSIFNDFMFIVFTSVCLVRLVLVYILKTLQFKGTFFYSTLF